MIGRNNGPGRLSLRTRFAAAITFLVVGVTLLLGWIVSVEVGRQVRGDIGYSLADVARQMADKLDRSMAARVTEAQLLSNMQVLAQADDPDAIRSQLENLQKSYDVVSWIGFTDAQGTVMAATGGILEGVDISHRPVFIEGREGTWVGDVHEAVMLASLLPKEDGEPVKFVDVAVPVHGPDGSLSGVLAVHLSWGWAKIIKDTIISPAEVLRGVEVYVVARDGVVLLGPDGTIGQSLATLDMPPPDGVLDANWHVLQWPDGDAYLTGRAASDGEGAFPGLGWTILARQPEAAAFAPVRSLQLEIAAVGAVLAILFAGIGWGVAGRLSAPLLRLAAAADRIRRDTTHECIPLETGSPELLKLSRSLRTMVGRLLDQSETIGQLTDAVHTDPLTGLNNRAFMTEHMDRILADAAREDRAVAVLFLDLDGFKQVNDTLGHEAGDILLVEVANRLRETLRGGDIAVRLGGDEFVLILKTDPDKVEWLVTAVGNRLIQAVTEPVRHPEFGTARVGCSIGAAFWPTHGATTTEVMAQADQALYAAKNTGKGRIVIHDPAADAEQAARA
ncbi:hypothetical protein C882_1452 [Caenispirillum salinarum AK4]|uniref:Diguanylate cyclase n=1 Tax=Caenispirillum salinarum AK4 TaxID=1238182 RepID=K9HG65_9PROT|nr:sensor domain-containing diguanylate cyclase [Caenispirillum salinarum]EKV27606.1 hypothetical protein C882_1452 [Caenispirillum salinarum AK4]